ncbi:ATP-dependent endonuclease [Hydrogenophaga sp.]|uniref:ATP-dependent nuclease n=1 Tax=Hydrogenophaga sp. TaxID=1904254 RepID=UPI0035B3108B
MAKTQLKKLNIRKFRALNNVEIEFGTHVTVICGKNGTSKSSILGVAAQIFSFEQDYTTGTSLQFQTITGGQFKSFPKEHFRFSDQFDVPGSLDVAVELFDGYTGSNATAELELSKRGKGARPVVRKNSTATDSNTSRNFTHPVIYLSLKRLLPIAERSYSVSNIAYLKQNQQRFLNLTNELLNKTSSIATSTEGSIQSAVAHGANYDQDSVSAGEDNAGQIMLALMSFRKLKEDNPAGYKGGLLLIDEADAGLFPAAQKKLVEILDRECHELDLQVVMTSHSPTLIEYTFEQSQKYRRRFKTIYLSDTYGGVQSMHNMSWANINADLHTKTVSSNGDVSLPLVNVYFEDQEGCDFFSALMYRHPAKKYITLLNEVSLGCSNYIQLAQRGVPEFAQKSVICLDADVDANKIKKLHTITLLPGSLPPDQLIFEYLFNLPASHEIWKNPQQITRPVFTAAASDLIRELSISTVTIDVKMLVESYRAGDEAKKKKLRETFKSFYKKPEIQGLMTQRKASYNPWRCWSQANEPSKTQFCSLFVAKLKKIMTDGFSVDSSKLGIFDVM